MLDVLKIREDFPMLKKTMHGKPLIYLDNGATTLKPQCVIDSVCDYLTNYSGNAHRGDYDLSHEVDTKFEYVRSIVADFIHCKPEEVVYTYGSSDSLNMVAFGYGVTHLKEGDEVLITLAEHASNTLPWFEVAKHTGAIIKYIDLDEEGKVTLENVKKAVTEHTKIISLAQITNVLGYLAPIKEICNFAHEHDIIVCVDGAQSAPHHAVDVQDLDVDFFAFSGHKMCGPTGVGVLYGKYHLLDEMTPTRFGGGSNARYNSCGLVKLKNAPTKFETGTPNIEGVIGLGSAIEYLQNIGMKNIEEHEAMLRKYAVEKMKELDNTGMVSQNLTLQAAETWLDNIAHLLRLLTEHTPGESVPVPCLMVYAAGRPARWTPAETEWQGWINNADDAVIEASHWQIMMEAPHVQACAQHITRWLCATSTQPENTL